MKQPIHARKPLLLASVTLCGILLAACSTGAAADGAAPIPAGDGKPAAEGTPTDASIASTCAAVSVIQTTLHNARQHLAFGTITADQYVAVAESAYTGYLSLTAFPETQRGLRDEFETVVDFIEEHPDTAQGARFAPTAVGYNEALEPVREACASSLSELATFSTTGG